MTRYAATPILPSKHVKARGDYLRVHYKNTRETAAAIAGLKLSKAKSYLEDVRGHRQCVPFRRHNGGVGRTAQAKAFGQQQGRWPTKSAEFLLNLLQNLESNAEAKGLDTDSLAIQSISVQHAPKQRRRTYRAHGRINPYQSSPCHIEIIGTELSEDVPKWKDQKEVVHKLNKRQNRRLEIERARTILPAVTAAA